MPAKPSWHSHIVSIRRSLTAMTSTPSLDRPAIERLFGLRARQANYLMRGLPGRRLGSAVVIDREALLAHLDELAAPRGVARAATQRKASVLETLDALRREGRPRRIPPPPPPAARGALPAGVRLAAPGELALAFATPEQLLGRILALAQAASSNFAAFAQSLEFLPAGRDAATDSLGATAPACHEVRVVRAKEVAPALDLPLHPEPPPDPGPAVDPGPAAARAS
jgi:hypothetical protein